MKNYVIIDADAINNRIAELEKNYTEKAALNDNQWCSIIAGQIICLKQVLSQSTPLAPQIDKALNKFAKSIPYVTRRN